MVYYLTDLLILVFIYSTIILISDLFLGTYLSLCIYLSCSFVTVSKLFHCEVFEAFVILLAILLPIKSRVASVFF